MSDTDNKAPREFWLLENPIMKGNYIVNYTSDRVPVFGKYDFQHIHVIEKSAYDSLQSRLEKCEGLLRELESKIVFNSENQSKIDEYFAEVEK